MREIVLDTETTGFKPEEGHRIVEIGALEIVNLIPTGKTYHQYIHPERDMPADAFAVHGISEEFLKDKPRFHEIAAAFLDFVQDSPLVIHNAKFDMNFLNYELSKAGFKQLERDRAVDTLEIARRKFPGARASLDALATRFGIDNSHRTLHGALLDSEILADVYLELKGGRQVSLGLDADPVTAEVPEADTEGGFAGPGSLAIARATAALSRTKKTVLPSAAEQEAHARARSEISNPLWNRYLQRHEGAPSD